MYPLRGFHEVKGIQPDFWPVPADLAPGLGTVSMNLFWPEWEPAPTSPPCGPAMVEHASRCFTVPSLVDSQIRAYTALGVAVTGILYGTPAWARGSRPCTPVSPGFEVFCVPDDPTDYARFAGMIAERYNGANGNGRVVDFVIQNEVNTNQWFNIGCGAGIPCDLDEWVADYAGLYIAAYDAVRPAQPHSRVLFSFTHHFGSDLDQSNADHPVYSIQTFLPMLVDRVGERDWSVALHPYPNNSLSRLDARDLPFATFGNIGVLPGWLRARFPNDPHAWEVQLTEVGFHNDGSLDSEQSEALCEAFRNMLGTPGITSFIYHRLSDHPDEFGLKLGLRHANGTPKPAYEVWRHVTDPDRRSCGFERDGHTAVQHGIDHASGAQWFSSRGLPAGYLPEPEQWILDYAERPGTAMLHECAYGLGTATYLWTSADCDSDTPMGPVGWIDTSPSPGLTALRACTGPDYRIATTAEACATQEAEVILGYVAGTPGPTRQVSTTTGVAPPVTSFSSSGPTRSAAFSARASVPRFAG